MRSMPVSRPRHRERPYAVKQPASRAHDGRRRGLAPMIRVGDREPGYSVKARPAMVQRLSNRGSVGGKSVRA